MSHYYISAYEPSWPEYFKYGMPRTLAFDDDCLDFIEEELELDRRFQICSRRLCRESDLKRLNKCNRCENLFCNDHLTSEMNLPDGDQNLLYCHNCASTTYWLWSIGRT